MEQAPKWIELTHELMTEHKCHTVILFGSWARRTASAESDLDIVGIFQEGTAYPLAQDWHGYLLDAMLYPEADLKDPTQFMHLRGAGILGGDPHGYWQKWISALDKLWEQPPPPLPPAKRQQLLLWAYKMLTRAQRQDIEGGFRQVWLAHDLLEIYHQWRGIWYPGSKLALEQMAAYDPETYRLFEKVYPYPQLVDLTPLVHRVFASENKPS